MKMSYKQENIVPHLMSLALLLAITCQLAYCDDQANLIEHEGKLSSILSTIKKASFHGVDTVSRVAVSIPFTKILMTAGALLGLLFVFMRILIVIGPILLLGALTRESTDATDLLKMLVEFYNQVIVALDDQMSQSSLETAT